MFLSRVQVIAHHPKLHCSFTGKRKFNSAGLNALLWIAYMSACSALAPWALALAKWRWIDVNSRLIFGLVTTSLTADAVSLLMMRNGINTWPIGNIFLIIQFCVFFLILNSQSKHNSLLWKYILVICLLLFILNYFFVQSPKKFNSYTSYSTAILLILISLKYLYGLIAEMPVDRVQTLHLFWISFGVLQYYGGTLLLFLFTNYLIDHQPQTHQTIWALHNALNILKNGLLLIAIWINYKSQISFK